MLCWMRVNTESVAAQSVLRCVCIRRRPQLPFCGVTVLGWVGFFLVVYVSRPLDVALYHGRLFRYPSLLTGAMSGKWVGSGSCLQHTGLWGWENPKPRGSSVVLGS